MIPFEVPDRFVGMIAAGTARRLGTTIRDAASGRILAHLQETSLLPTTLGANPIGLLLSGGQLASSVVANYQLEQVKRMLSGLRVLTSASLAVSVVGVGVSVAGFALVMRRLRDLEGQVAGVGREVLAARLAAERAELRLETRDGSRAESLLYRAEEAWDRSDARDVWRQLEGPLDEEQRYWRALVGDGTGRSVFLDGRFTLEQAVAAYGSVLTLAAARVQALLLLDETEAARRQTEELCRWHEQTMLGLTAVDLARVRAKQLAAAAGLREVDARARLLDTSHRFLTHVCEIHLGLAGRQELVRSLAERGVSGCQYLHELRRRQDTPLVEWACGDGDGNNASSGAPRGPGG